MKHNHLIILMLTAILAGCLQTAPKVNAWATGHKFDSLQQPTDDSALLYIMREKSFHRENEWPTVALNNQDIVNLKNTGYTYTHIKPGTYKVTTRDSSWANEISISLESNQTYFLVLEIDKNISRGHGEAFSQFLLMGYVGDASSNATRKWTLIGRNDALFRLQHYHHTPLIKNEKPNVDDKS